MRGTRTMPSMVGSGIANRFNFGNTSDPEIAGLRTRYGITNSNATTPGSQAALAFQAIRQQATLLGQRMLSRASNFRKRHAAIAPRDDMAGIGDIDLSFVIAAFHPPAFVHCKQFWMQRTAEHFRKPRVAVELAHRPEVLLLDEPLTGLDQASVQRMEAILLDTMFDLPGMDGVEKVHVDKDVVMGTKEPIRVYAKKGKAGDAA